MGSCGAPPWTGSGPLAHIFGSGHPIQKPSSKLCVFSPFNLPAIFPVGASTSDFRAAGKLAPTRNRSSLTSLSTMNCSSKHLLFLTSVYTCFPRIPNSYAHTHIHTSFLCLWSIDELFLQFLARCRRSRLSPRSPVCSSRSVWLNDTSRCVCCFFRCVFFVLRYSNLICHLAFSVSVFVFISRQF